MAFVTLAAPVGTHRFSPTDRRLRPARGPRCAPPPPRSRGGVARVVATDSAAAEGKGAAGGVAPVSTQYDPTPLHTALLPPKTDLKRVRQMLNDHASGKSALDLHAVDAHRRTALHVAAGLGMLDIVERLVSLGADVNAQDIQGLTPLHMASGYARPSTVEALLRAAEGLIDLSLRDMQNRTALELAQMCLRNEPPRKFIGLVPNQKHSAYTQVVELLYNFSQRSAAEGDDA